VSGTGRRRKPNPDEEGNLPAPPRAPAGYSPPPQPEYDYAYDWRTPSAAQPDPRPAPDSGSGPGSTPTPGGANFDAFNRSGAASPDQSGGYYNPVGHGLQDPYSAAAYAPSSPVAPPAQPQPSTRQPDPQSFPHQPPSTSYAPPSYSPPQSRAAAPQPDLGGLFDENDLFDTGSSPVATPAPPASQVPAPQAPQDAVLSATGTSPVVPPPSADAPRPQDGYAASDFAFLEEETGHDVNSWLTFVESRAESRADRIKQFRVRLIGIGVAVALVGVGIGGYFLFNGGPLGSKPVTKSVILLQLSDTTGNAVADALLVADRSATPSASGTGAAVKTVTGKGAAVLIPSQMLVNSLGFGEQPFSGVAAQNIPAAGKDTVADALGVTIDGVWRMDKITFAGLIDEIGGVQVTTNTAVPAVTASPTAAAVPAGTEKLTGGQAVAYGTYTRAGEAAGAQSERFGQVVAALLDALPADAAAITSYLNHLGIVDDPSLPESKLSPILAVLAAEQQAGAFSEQVLPLRTDGSNLMDAQAAAPIVSNLLGGALAAESPGQVSRVLVEDATGHTGAQSQSVRGAAQAKLTNSGYTYLDGSTAARRGTSVVEVASADKKSAAVQIAETLGLQATNVQVVSGLSSIADVTVLLGADWPNLAGVTVPTATAATSPSASASANNG